MVDCNSCKFLELRGSSLLIVENYYCKYRKARNLPVVKDCENYQRAYSEFPVTIGYLDDIMECKEYKEWDIQDERSQLEADIYNGVKHFNSGE